jgi:hypothetical protein
MERRGVRWPNVQSRRIALTGTLEEIKAWRTGVAAGGRPSAFSDYCRANGLSTDCDAQGVLLNDDGIGFKLVGWDDGAMLFEYCSACSGTGVALAE